jgi:hypothetical protein
MYHSFLAFALVALTTFAFARPLELELITREPEPGNRPAWFFPVPSKGGNGGNAQSGSSGSANGGSVYQEASPYGYIYNGYGSGKVYFYCKSGI